MATLSILGLYNYDNSVLDEMVLPTRLERETVIDNLLMELAELEFLYPDAGFAKKAIKVWSKKQIRIWDKLLDTTLLEYNPIENYNRVEKIEDKETRALNKKTSAVIRENVDTDVDRNESEIADKLEKSNQENTNNDTTTNSGSDVTSVSEAAFNTSPSPVETTTATRGTSATNTGRVEANVTVNNNDSLERESNENSSTVRTGDNTETVEDGGEIVREHNNNTSGNIGVTTTQEMIKQERETVIYNVIDTIIRDFKQRFCIMVY